MLGYLKLLILCPAVFAAPHNELLPQPRKVVYAEGKLPLQDLSVVSAPEDRFEAGELEARLELQRARSSRNITLIRTGPADPLPGRDDKTGPDSRESYRIRITPAGGEVRARSSAGLYYAVQTLAQLVENGSLPAVEIEDWPSLAYRGVMMDLSHGALPAEEEIKRQIDFLARWKGNQYYFYSEFSIELKGYSLINPHGRYSQEQVRRIVDYARSRHVDVVPCLEFYGHMHDLFLIERYADLAALPHGGDLNPRHPRMQQMLQDWVGQMAVLFPSAWFHIGLDEPWELERAGSAAAGGVKPGDLYLEHLNRMSELVRRHGKRVLFWADVAAGAALFEKYPELAAHLPADTIPVPWHYHAEKDYNRMLEPFTKARVPQVIGTGIWAWDTIVPNFPLTFTNIDGFLRDGRKHGTLGIINTNWADDAQVLYRMTLPGIAYGAISAWQPEPVDRERFFDRYAARYYGQSAAEDVAAGLRALSEAGQAMLAALGSEDMFRLWDDPLAPERLARMRARLGDLRKVRLAAENAEERFTAAIEHGCGDESISTLRLGARLASYAGLKYIYAVEIADGFEKLGPKPTRADVSFWLGRQASARNHGRIMDLMDLIGELREEYRRAWEAEYTPYRLRTALGRFDAEFEYWRRLQARVWDAQRSFREGGPAPSLEQVRR